MTPDMVMRKVPFTRIAPSETLSPFDTGYAVTKVPSYQEGHLSYYCLTQADFLREFDQNAHKIT